MANDTDYQTYLAYYREHGNPVMLSYYEGIVTAYKKQQLKAFYEQCRSVMSVPAVPIAEISSTKIGDEVLKKQDFEQAPPLVQVKWQTLIESYQHKELLKLSLGYCSSLELANNIAELKNCHLTISTLREELHYYKGTGSLPSKVSIALPDDRAELQRMLLNARSNKSKSARRHQDALVQKWQFQIECITEKLKSYAI